MGRFVKATYGDLMSVCVADDGRDENVWRSVVKCSRVRGRRSESRYAFVAS